MDVARAQPLRTTAERGDVYALSSRAAAAISSRSPGAGCHGSRSGSPWSRRDYVHVEVKDGLPRGRTARVQEVHAVCAQTFLDALRHPLRGRRMQGEVKIEASGFGALTKTGIIVSAAQPVQQDVQLALGNQEISLNVMAESGALVQAEAPVRGGTIETGRITELPYAGRNPVDLALTLPGVSSNRGGFGVGTFAINGARARSNNFLMDGVQNNDMAVTGQGVQITNPDAVQEVSVQTSNYDAEFGRAGGGVINVITKAGTNSYHGTLVYLLDSTRDDALTSLQSRDPETVKRGYPQFGTQNTYSGTIGGPIIKNRTFFFGAYQELRQRSNAQATFQTPTAAGREALRRIFPAGASANVDLLLGLTESAVANSSPFSIALGTGPSGGGDRGTIEFGNFTRSFAATNLVRSWQARVDHKLSENDQLSGSFVTTTTDQPAGAVAGLEGFNVDAVFRFYNFILSETHVFSSTLTNEARVAYNRISILGALADPDGLAGTLPFITVPQISTLGVTTQFPQGRIQNNYTAQDTVTWVRGNHTLRGGVEYVRQIATDAAPYNSRGSVTYAASSAPTYTAFANFVDNFGGDTNLGNAARDIGSAVSNPNLHRTAVFFQDRWRASNALTLTLGIRYEYFGQPFNSLRTPAFTGLFNVDPVTRTGPYSEPNQVNGDWNNWAPTIGFAYSPGVSGGWLGTLIGENKTVIRGGYQVGYDAFFTNITSNAAVSSPNIVSTTNFSLANAANPRGTPNFTGLIPTTAAPLTPLSGQTLIQQDLVNPYYQRWSLGVQRELPYKLLLDVSYVGSKGTKLYINEDWNPTVPAEHARDAPGSNNRSFGSSGQHSGTEDGAYQWRLLELSLRTAECQPPVQQRLCIDRKLYVFEIARQRE